MLLAHAACSRNTEQTQAGVAAAILLLTVWLLQRLQVVAEQALEVDWAVHAHPLTKGAQLDHDAHDAVLCHCQVRPLRLRLRLLQPLLLQADHVGGDAGEVRLVLGHHL
jgi:hypothetical protein